jgi:hypothetical protein
MEKTCLHRLFGECKSCEIDYELISLNHPVNNYNCLNYKEVHIITIMVSSPIFFEKIIKSKEVAYDLDREISS